MSGRDMARLLALIEKSLGAEWLDIADWLREQNSLDAVERRLLAGDYQGLVAEVESAARRFAAATHEGYITAGRRGAQWLDGKLDDRLVRFDAASDRAVIAARRNKLELVHGLTQETREVVRTAIIDGQRAGENPRSIARDIRDSLTLTPAQAQHVANYRRQLETGDFGGAMRRELRDARSDRTLRRLSRDDGALTEKQVDDMVEAYRRNYVAYRAEVVARTESARNVHAGIEESFRQAIERGDVDAEQLVREWIHAARGKDSRPDHVAMDGKQQKFGEPFVFPDGTRKMYPGDGAGGAEHDANCRCAIATTMAA